MISENFDAFLRAVGARKFAVLSVAAVLGIWAVLHFGTEDFSEADRDRTEQTRITQELIEHSEVRLRSSMPVRPKRPESQLEDVVLGFDVGTVPYAEQLEAAADKLSEALQKWKELSNRISDSEEGRRLAADTPMIPKMLSILLNCNKQRELSRESIARAHVIAEEVRVFLQDMEPKDITTKARLGIEKHLQMMNAYLETYESGCKQFEDWSEKNKYAPPSKLTLREAFIEHRAAEDQKERDLRIAAQEKVKEENAQKIIEEERKRQEAVQRVKELELARETERLEAVAKALEAQKEADRILAEAKRNRAILESEFVRDQSRIQYYLGPLFIKTTKQPGGGHLAETKESKPVSLSALKSIGLSNPDIHKACGSLLLFFSYFSAGERGRGPYPRHYNGGGLNPEQMNAIRPAYDLLDKYGELLVEKGMLSE